MERVPRPPVAVLVLVLVVELLELVEAVVMDLFVAAAEAEVVTAADYYSVQTDPDFVVQKISATMPLLQHP